MLLDNCGDGNRKSPATDHPTPERKKSFIVTLPSESSFFPRVSWVLQTAIVTGWRAFVRQTAASRRSLRFAPSTNHWNFL